MSSGEMRLGGAGPDTLQPDSPRLSRMARSSAVRTIHWAAEHGDLAELQRHVQHGIEQGRVPAATLHTRDTTYLGMFPLSLAAEHGHINIIQFCIKHQVDLDARDAFGVTALHLASIAGHTQCVKLLLEQGADSRATDVDGDMPLHWAATRGQIQAMQLLLGYGSPINPTNSKGWTPLHRAAYNGRKEAVVLLLQSNADVNLGNQEGDTAVHLAAYMNHLSVLELLLFKGGNQHKANKRGLLPYHMCITDGARQLVGLPLSQPQHPTQAAASPVHATPTAQEKEDAEAQLAQRLYDMELADALRAKRRVADSADFPEQAGRTPVSRAPAVPSQGGPRRFALVSDFLSTAAGTSAGVNPYQLTGVMGSDASRSDSERGSNASRNTPLASAGVSAGGPASARGEPSARASNLSGTMAQELGAAKGSRRPSVSGGGALSPAPMAPRASTPSLADSRGSGGSPGPAQSRAGPGPHPARRVSNAGSVGSALGSAVGSVGGSPAGGADGRPSSQMSARLSSSMGLSGRGSLLAAAAAATAAVGMESAARKLAEQEPHWEGGDRPSASEWQEHVRAENRRLAAETASRMSGAGR